MELLVIWALCAITAAVIASSKGRSGFGWFLLGVLIGIFAVIIVACLPSLKRPRVAAISSGPINVDPQQPTKACPRCAETIKKAALLCRFCGYEFVHDDASIVTQLDKIAPLYDRTRDPPSVGQNWFGSTEYHRLEDGTVAVNTRWGWRRFKSIEHYKPWAKA